MVNEKFVPRIFSLLIILVLLTQMGITSVQAKNMSAPRNAALNPTPPVQPVKLIFIHHSTGENLLRDDYGQLGIALKNNQYFVSDTNYGWGPNSIGDRTDIPNWTEWFRSADTATYMDALIHESEQHANYTRLASDPGGENQIIVFKSCFPNSNLEGNPNDPPSADGWLTVGHAKWVYNQILQYFKQHPEKLFVVITAPPVQDSTYAANARAFNQWLMNNWLSSNNYMLKNVAVFDFYNVLTGPNNHHRYINGAIEHVFTPGMNTSYYPSEDDHPSAAGSRKATTEFVPLLNIFYHQWRDGIAPNVLSITRANVSPTTAASVNFTVKFSENVTGVNVDDFSLTRTGSTLTGTAISTVSGSNDTYTVSVATGSGSGTIRLNVVDNDSILDADSNPLGGPGNGNGNFVNGEIYAVRPVQQTFPSTTQDGWLLESGEDSNAGGTTNNIAGTFRLGDDAARKQYRSILSFNTGSLPDNASILSVTLKITQESITGGGNPATAFQGFMVDIKNGFFNSYPALQIADFQETADGTYGPAKPTPAGNVYSISLTNGKANINKLAASNGLTQIRLRFKLDDNNNAVANYISLYSGDAPTEADRPQLVVTYIVP